MAKKHIKTNVMRILESAKIEHKAIFYDCPNFTDGASIAKKLGENEEDVYKTLVTENKAHECFVFVIPVAEELDLKRCAAAVGQKSVEMIHVKDINRITGYIRGGCSPIGMKKQFPTVIDHSAADKPYIIISGGKLGVQISLGPKDLAELIDAKFAQIIKQRCNT